MPPESAFPSILWFNSLARQVNSDPDYLKAAHTLNARVAFAVGGCETVVLTLLNGKVVGIEKCEGLRGTDYRLEGPEEGWDLFWQERVNFPWATNQMYGKLRIKGNIVMAAGDSWALANLCRRFRQVPKEGVLQ